MAVKTKKTYYAFRVLIACAIFYFSIVTAKEVSAAMTCVDMFHNIDHPGTYTLTDNITGLSCIVASDGVVLDGIGHYSISAVDGSATVTGHDGYDFTIQNVTDISGGISSNGYNATAPATNGTNGGNITLIDSSIRSNIESKGGYSSYGVGGNGGTVLITNSGAIGISVLGGAALDVAPSNGGAGGSITLEAGSRASGVLVANGGSSNGGIGGLGGSITLQGLAASNALTAMGGSSQNGNGGNGGSVVITNSNATTVDVRGGVGATGGYDGDGGIGGTINISNNANVSGMTTANGGDSYGAGDGSTGGTVIIQDSRIQNLNVLGGISTGGNFGMGGSVNIQNSGANSINVTGGGSDTYSSYTRTGGTGGTIVIGNGADVNNAATIGGATYYGNGGAGGTITVQNASLNYGYAVGGYSYDNGTGGTGGNIILESASTIYGGYTTGGFSERDTGGNGGTITLTNSESTYALECDGGGSYRGDPGNGGTVSITNSNAVLLRSNAGASYYGDYGNGGDITVTNSNVVEIRNVGTDNGDLTITDYAPTVIPTGGPTETLNLPDAYVEQGATASDTKYVVTPLTATPSGTVGTTAGVYVITYDSDPDDGTLPVWNGAQLVGAPTDRGVAPQSGSATHTVTVVAAPITHHSGSSGSYAPGYGPKIIQPTNPISPTTPNFTFTKNLKYLQIDNDVKELQKFLNTHNYIVSAIGAGSLGHETTKFGALTQKAVIKFQKANKLTPDGIVGPKTRGVINSLLK